MKLPLPRSRTPICAPNFSSWRVVSAPRPAGRQAHRAHRADCGGRQRSTSRTRTNHRRLWPHKYVAANWARSSSDFASRRDERSAASREETAALTRIRATREQQRPMGDRRDGGYTAETHASSPDNTASPTRWRISAATSSASPRDEFTSVKTIQTFPIAASPRATSPAASDGACSRAALNRASVITPSVSPGGTENGNVIFQSLYSLIVADPMRMPSSFPWFVLSTT